MTVKITFLVTISITSGTQPVGCLWDTRTLQYHQWDPTSWLFVGHTYTPVSPVGPNQLAVCGTHVHSSITSGTRPVGCLWDTRTLQYHQWDPTTWLYVGHTYTPVSPVGPNQLAVYGTHVHSSITSGTQPVGCLWDTRTLQYHQWDPTSWLFVGHTYTPVSPVGPNQLAVCGTHVHSSITSGTRPVGCLWDTRTLQYHQWDPTTWLYVGHTYTPVSPVGPNQLAVYGTHVHSSITSGTQPVGCLWDTRTLQYHQWDPTSWLFVGHTYTPVSPVGPNQLAVCGTHVHSSITSGTRPVGCLWDTRTLQYHQWDPTTWLYVGHTYTPVSPVGPNQLAVYGTHVHSSITSGTQPVGCLWDTRTLQYHQWDPTSWLFVGHTYTPVSPVGLNQLAVCGTHVHSSITSGTQPVGCLWDTRTLQYHQWDPTS